MQTSRQEKQTIHFSESKDTFQDSRIYVQSLSRTVRYTGRAAGTSVFEMPDLLRQWRNQHSDLFKVVQSPRNLDLLTGQFYYHSTLLSRIDAGAQYIDPDAIIGNQMVGYGALQQYFPEK